MSFDGGGLRNAIPREASCFVAIQNNECDSFSDIFRTMVETFKDEYDSIE